MIISIILSKITAWMKYRDSVRQLSSLTDRELQDIGLERGNIENAARGLAFN